MRSEIYTFTLVLWMLTIEGELVTVSPQAGPKGDQGPKGEKGHTGFPGEKGGRGLPGLNGPKGHAGLPGLDGRPGIRGPKGEPGWNMKGHAGPQGVKGDVGEHGMPGRPGERGPVGERGPPGPKGDMGREGRPGVTGLDGLPGQKGHPGDADENECLGPHGCHHACVNTHGSYTCTCDAGYKLKSNGKACEDVNECEANNAMCEHQCNNTEGSFTCTCAAGYVLTNNKHTCEDVDECSEAEIPLCSQVCLNIPGSYRCLVLVTDGLAAGDKDDSVANKVHLESPILSPLALLVWLVLLSVVILMNVALSLGRWKQDHCRCGGKGSGDKSVLYSTGQATIDDAST